MSRSRRFLYNRRGRKTSRWADRACDCGVVGHGGETVLPPLPVVACPATHFILTLSVVPGPPDNDGYNSPAADSSAVSPSTLSTTVSHAGATAGFGS